MSRSASAEEARPSRRLLYWALGLALVLVLAAGLLLGRTAGGQPDRPAVNGTPTAETKAVEQPPTAPPRVRGVRTLPAPEQLARAFEAAFGEADRATRELEEAELTYTPGGFQWIRNRAILVSPGRNRDDCHACAGAIAVHYLEPARDGFAVRGEWLAGGGYDDRGQPPGWRFSTEISKEPLLRTEGSGGNQGIFCTNVTFYAFGRDGPQTVVEVPVGYSNASGFGDDNGTELSGRITSVKRDQSFLVEYTGTRRFSERYERREGRYVLASGNSQVPTC